MSKTKCKKKDKKIIQIILSAMYLFSLGDKISEEAKCNLS